MPKKPHVKKKPNEEILDNINKLRSELKDALSVSRDELMSNLGKIVEEVNKTLKDFLTSSELQNLIENLIKKPDRSLGEILKNYLNMEVELITSAGILHGSITSIEEDFIIFQETFGYQTLVPFTHITGITIKGSV